MVMSSHAARCLGCFLPIIFTLLFLQPASPAQADTLLEVYVEDHQALPGQQNVVIPIYMKNYSDTVAGFSLWLQLDRPDIMEFQITFDTSGTLISGWEFVEVNSLGGLGYDILVVGLADIFPLPITPGIGPQLADIPLVKVIADVYNIPDTMTERTVLIHINDEFLDHFSFSDPYGNTIGIAYDSILDTSWFVCTEWLVPDSICLNWQQVSGPPADSIDVHLDSVPYLDTTRVIVTDGSLTVLNILCGDIDGSGGDPNIADLTYFVDYLFRGGPPPPYMEKANVDGDNGVNVADLTYLVDYLFRGGPAPVC